MSQIEILESATPSSMSGMLDRRRHHPLRMLRRGRHARARHDQSRYLQSGLYYKASNPHTKESFIRSERALLVCDKDSVRRFIVRLVVDLATDSSIMAAIGRSYVSPVLTGINFALALAGAALAGWALNRSFDSPGSVGEASHTL